MNPSHPNLTNPPSHLSLDTTLSSLNHLLSLSNRTLSSPNPNYTLPLPQNDTLIPCPYNPHHLMPPHSLFYHSLRCPSPLDLSLHSLNYPNTLNPPINLHFTQKLDRNPDIELCFSLDEYLHFGSNFFYKDCPGVVCLSDLDSAKRTFTLPCSLSVECENFVGVSEREIKGFDKMGFRLVASDLWALNGEIEFWSDYPNGYSFNVCSALLGLNFVEDSDFKKWVIANSPRFGVLIDVYMRDHMCVLFRLCLKAIVKEAFGLVNCYLEGNLRSLSFRCPVLVQVLMWLASQLSVLFGDVNGKMFAIDMLKKCVLEAARKLLLFRVDEKKVDENLDAKSSEINDVKLKQPSERITECELVRTVDDTVVGGVIFVSQVAAAVAALHERSFLEEKIKALRFPQPLPRYQRMAEHDYFSKRADEERKKRPNYRPIIEHDGLPRQHSSNQELNKSKTREELLAEERDYKRRRMSYRGKKLKRTALEVTRDLIEDFMEEIKQAGGIGSFVKGAEERGILPSESLAVHDITTNFQLNKSYSDSLDAVNSDNCRKQSQYNNNNNITSTTWEDSSSNDYGRQSQSLQGRHEHLEYSRREDRGKHGGEYRSEILERHRSHGRSHERSNGRRERSDAEFTRNRHHDLKRQSSSMSNHRDDRVFLPVSKNVNDSIVRKGSQNLELKNRHQRKTYGNHHSDTQNTFDDRYDPSESHDMYEDDGGYTGNQYNKLEEF
ncbi:zf-U11-48K domain-containing protein [Cephalotus follicularis]|uniref:Zf-U11-48K domain-containing protein n=1 Tax=Cephalotus follicularis TaxID=3775 RepID=A0A1Q3BNY1_CEPFO|nr:zf-U11-48K domain-containing protein [Cephalotus follicularis]